MHPARLQAALEATEVRACFLGHTSFSSDDLAGYMGPKPQHHGASDAELDEAATWIRRRSIDLRDQCHDAALPYVDIGEVGFEGAMTQARHHLLGRD